MIKARLHYSKGTITGDEYGTVIKFDQGLEVEIDTDDADSLVHFFNEIRHIPNFTADDIDTLLVAVDNLYRVKENEETMELADLSKIGKLHDKLRKVRQHLNGIRANHLG